MISRGGVARFGHNPEKVPDLAKTQMRASTFWSKFLKSVLASLWRKLKP